MEKSKLFLVLRNKGMRKCVHNLKVYNQVRKLGIQAFSLQHNPLTPHILVYLSLPANSYLNMPWPCRVGLHCWNHSIVRMCFNVQFCYQHFSFRLILLSFGFTNCWICNFIQVTLEVLTVHKHKLIKWKLNLGLYLSCSLDLSLA